MRRAVGIGAIVMVVLAAGAARAAEPLPSWMLLPGTAGSGDSPSECAWLREIESQRFGRGMFTEMDAYAGMGDGFAAMATMYLAAVVPNVGMQLERGAASPAVALSWSATAPFGPVTACRTSRYGGSLHELQPLRAVLEGGFVIRSQMQAFLRPALRALWQRSSWPLGVGVGLGSTLAIRSGNRGAASISPELLIHYGSCCAPGYFLLSVRGDLYFPRSEPAAMVTSLGFTYW